MLLRGCLHGAHTTRVPVVQRCAGLMSPQPHRSLHLCNMMLNLENRQWHERSNPVSATEVGAKEMLWKQMKMELEWDQPPGELPELIFWDVILVTLKSAEQTSRANPSDRSAFCLVVSKSHWNSLVLYRLKRAWSWSLCYFLSVCKPSFQNLLVGGVKMFLITKAVLRVHMCVFF